MAAVDLVISPAGCRRWHRVLAERLQAAGHDVGVSVVSADSGGERTLDGILALERIVSRTDAAALSAAIQAFEWPRRRPADLVIDLAGARAAAGGDAPVATVLFQGQEGLVAAAEMLARGDVPVVEVLVNGKCVARAAPMTSSRAFVSRGLEDVLARAVTLLVGVVDRFPALDGRPGASDAALPPKRTPATGRSLASAFALSTLPRLAARAAGRLRYHGDHWRVGYRFHDGPGVAETGSLAGAPWQVLPDDGRRFYADPFPCEWEGRHFIFVEELVHAGGKGVLSVSSCDGEGRFDVPRVVLEEPFHLSYPQVFHRDGHHWMIPEGGAGRKLVLYRAERFPDRWTRHAVLLEGREIFDATLFDHGGLVWLIGTERDGAGSASDTMVAFFAERLEGPWRAHPLNPILIDKAAARPGGGVARIGGRLVLPVQDGTLRYGGGLGLCEILTLDPDRAEFTRPVPIDGAGGWPYPQIHTLNRAGRLETIDGLARVRKKR